MKKYCYSPFFFEMNIFLRCARVSVGILVWVSSLNVFRRLIFPDFNASILKFRELRFLVNAYGRFNSYHLPFLVIIFDSKVHSCKSYNNKLMIALTYITNPKSFAFIAFLVCKLLSRKEFVYKQNRQ